jgi:uroporphyrinogen-III synthase
VTAPVLASDDEPLSGFTIAVTADRRRDEFAALLQRRGARTVVAPTLRMLPLTDDTTLREHTVALIAHAPDVVVVTTAIGVRAWLEAADGWDLGEPLCEAFAAAYLIVRGPKAKGAVRAAGLTENWSPPGESGEEILDHLRTRGIAGARIALQRHGEDGPAFGAALRAAGADVIEASVYRWGPPADTGAVRRLVEAIVNRQVDAITFTSAPAVTSLLDIAGDDADEVIAALRNDVLAACIGPVTAEPLRVRDVPVLEPGRSRLGALARILAEELPVRRPIVRVAGAEIRLRGHAALVDGELRPLASAPMAVLRTLVAASGRVCSRAELLTALPRGTDEHAVEMAVTRLRTALGRRDLVQTVVKRGYRLKVDEA